MGRKAAPGIVTSDDEPVGCTKRPGYGTKWTNTRMAPRQVTGPHMNTTRILTACAALAVVGGAVWYTSAGPSNDATPTELAEGAPMVQVTLPDSLSEVAQIGQRGFEAKCAVCHGANAAGQNGIAPPLVHKIYEPSHHGDASFQLAALQGVRAHHWRFGNMPPVDGVTPADVTAITAYVRELQRANGIN